MMFRYFSFFQEITGRSEEYIHLKRPDVKGLIEFLTEKYRAKSANMGFGLNRVQSRLEFMISVNGELSDLESSLRDNDEVSLLPPMGGG